MLRISNYATASTDSAAYIIGGFNGDDKVSTIAEFKNNKWRKIGNLNEPKSGPSVIFNNGEYIVIGGNVESGR